MDGKKKTVETFTNNTSMMAVGIAISIVFQVLVYEYTKHQLNIYRSLKIDLQHTFERLTRPIFQYRQGKQKY